MVVTAFVFGDIMDGYMARKTGKSSTWGAFLDSTLDRFGDASIFGGLVLYYAQADAKTDLGARPSTCASAWPAWCSATSRRTPEPGPRASG